MSVLRTVNTSSRVFPSFSHCVTGAFTQAQPKLHNPFRSDPFLQKLIRQAVPALELRAIASDLDKFGNRICNELESLSLQCENEKPQLVQYDAWGNRVDRLVVSLAWDRMKEVSAEERLVSMAYQKSSVYSRVHQFAKLFLYAPSSGLYTCPLAMTDAAAKVISALSLHNETGDAFDRLTSSDPARFWTSGQWMTEKMGGSDVGYGSETVAVRTSDGEYELNGLKWFSSATDADMALTLARPVDDTGAVASGSRGLDMFYVRMRNSGDRLNGIQIVRLKDKLGTRQLPTAELLLDGCRATRLSHDGSGILAISNMLNITRLYNSICACGGMSRMIQLSRDYMTRRHAFGATLDKSKLHVLTVTRLAVEARGCLAMVMEAARLLGIQEHDRLSSTQSLLLRLLLPLIKLYTGKKAVPMCSEALESFGGTGYLEDTGIPRHLRDAQVLPIWEGTTNVLSHDVLRVLSKHGVAVFEAVKKEIGLMLQNTDGTPLAADSDIILQSVTSLGTFAVQHSDILPVAARDFSMSLARVIGAALLVRFSVAENMNNVDVYCTKRWIEDEPLLSLRDPKYYESACSNDHAVLFDGYFNSI